MFGLAMGKVFSRLREEGRSCRLDCVIAVAAFALATGCGTAVKRDLSGIPAGQVGFDDLCGVQDYFDEIAVNVGRSIDIYNSRTLGVS